MSWQLEYESRIEEAVESETYDTLVYDFLSQEVNYDWHDIDKVKGAVFTVHQRLSGMWNESTDMDKKAIKNAIQWYKENEDVDGMSDKEIENIPDFEDAVERDLEIMWDDFQELYIDDFSDMDGAIDEYELRDKITNIQDDMNKFVNKLENKIIPKFQKEIIMEMFKYES